MFHQAFETFRLRAFSTFAVGVVTLTIAWTFANVAAAQFPGSNVPSSNEPPADRTFNVPLPGPDGQPTADVLIRAPGQGEVPVTEPYRQRAVDRNGQALIAGHVGPNVANDASEQFLQQRVQMLQAQQEQLSRAYQEALTALELKSPRKAQVEVEKQRLQTQLQLMKGQVAELASRQQPQQMSPLPENATLKVFALRYVKPDEIGNVLFRITGNDSMRMAFDDRTNSLLLAGGEKQLSIAEALIERLDQPSQAAEKRPAETLQLRVVWLLDGVPGKAPAERISTGDKEFDSFVSPQVVDALRELGFEMPQVMCQQLTTLTIRPEERRSGQFHFQVPVLVEDDLWQFSGQGSVSNSARDKYTLDIGLTVEQRDESNKRNTAELSGSIITPLAHYTVVGTTTFVATKLVPADGGRGKVVAGRNQHLAAFVVFLDRAREFGGESGKAEKKLPPPPK